MPKTRNGIVGRAVMAMAVFGGELLGPVWRVFWLLRVGTTRRSTRKK